VSKRPSSDPSVWEEPTLQPPLPADPSGHVGDEPLIGATRPALPTYGTDYRARRSATPASRRRFAVIAAALVAGPAGIIGAFLGAFASVGSLRAVVLAVVLIGPAVEEFVKAASALYLAEQRPWLVPSGWTLVAVVVAGGLGFAAIENWVYLTIYIEDPTEAIIRWRWIFGPLVHGSASLLAGLGVRRIWRHTHTTGAQPDAQRALPWFIASVALHGTYNAVAVVLEALDVI
jgi:RsiW-degrading membrane proteinase PrsW (M82 family)